jgi:hypothetical protein
MKTKNSNDEYQTEPTKNRYKSTILEFRTNIINYL